MPLCPACGQKSQQLGVQCTCGQAYTIKEEHAEDPLSLLGKCLEERLVPVDIYSVGNAVLAYEAWQSAVERMVTLLVIQPSLWADASYKRRFQATVNTFSNIYHQNLPMLIEEVDIAEPVTRAIVCDVRRGEMLNDFMQYSRPDDVILIHVIHQILQALATYHRYGLCVPNLGRENVQIVQSGGDTAFVRVMGVLESILSTPECDQAMDDDVWCMGQLALSLITGQPSPITNVELSDERTYLMPIVVLFMRATAPIEERFKNAGELLEEFETILDVKPKAAVESVSKIVNDDPMIVRKQKNLVEMSQLLWMHKPPFVQD